MVLLRTITNAIPWDPPCRHPNDLHRNHFNGIPYEQPQCKSMESQCIAHRNNSLEITNHQSPSNPIETTWGKPNVLPIRHFHGAPMEHYPSNSMGVPCGHPNGLPIEHIHGIPNEQPQCKPMESQCITQRTMPWNSQRSIQIP